MIEKSTLSKPNKHYENIIIGAGASGLTVAVGLAALKKDTLLISKNLGGECTNYGCVPSKRLINLSKKYASSTDEKYKKRISKNLGAEIKKTIIEIKHEEQELLDSKKINFILGSAEFINHNTLRLNHNNQISHITFSRAYIATGSRPLEIDFGINKSKILTNENIFELKEVPKSLTVVGFGVIGAEMANAFANLGTQVTILATGKGLKTVSPEFREVIHSEFKLKGIKIIDGLSREEVKEKIKKLPVTEYYLLSIGRIPNIQKLNLKTAGIEFDNKGIITNNNLRTTNKKVYALGDVTSLPKFTHLANNQGRFLVKKSVIPFVQRSLSPLPYSIFTQPVITSVGKTNESDFIKKFNIDFNSSDRGVIDQTKNLLGEVYIHTITGRIFGASLLGEFGQHGINFFTLMIHKKMTAFSLGNIMFPYPTLMGAVSQVNSAFLTYYMSHIKINLLKLIKKNISRILTGAFWLVMAISLLLYFKFVNYDAGVITDQLLSLFTSPIGLLLFVLVYVVKSFLIFVPATIITMLAGYLFGFWPGLMLVIVASNTSSSANYLLARTVFSAEKSKDTSGLTKSIQENTFEAVLVSRLTFMPYDFVSFLSGGLKAKFGPFILATFLGSIPGTIAIVSFGASLEDVKSFESFKLDPFYLVLSLVFIFLGIMGSKVLKKYNSKS
jgi:pyruvate/2-oxoglutarate dehydrogenase complex dihydrolipoamide dehydrogenase (E3) component/uncharacterized membrane protein YdjX (TVP38/TMEM64 family)